MHMVLLLKQGPTLLANIMEQRRPLEHVLLESGQRRLEPFIFVSAPQDMGGVT